MPGPEGEEADRRLVKHPRDRSATWVASLSVDINSDGDVYLAITNLDKVLQVDSSGVEIASWGVSGSGIGEFSQPKSVAVAPNGDVFVADGINFRVEKFGPPFKTFRADLPKEPAGRIVSPR